MSGTTIQTQTGGGDSLFRKVRLNRGWTFGAIIIMALMAFEVFNYSTTDFAMSDLLGDLRFAGVRWATILAIAFCGIDFAGIARLFTPEQGEDEPNEVWYLFGAWLLAATMNAMLTWWGVSIAILNHQTLGNAVIDHGTLLKVAPIFVAIIVWLIRVLIIGTFSVAGERLFSQADTNVRPIARVTRRTSPQVSHPITTIQRPRPAYTSSRTNPHPKPMNNIPEPSYHPVSMRGMGNENKTRQ
ncbi:MAG: hypothetical protein AB1345_09025 [Chloroflexota bacterium]